MEERAELLGGLLEFFSALGQGARVEVKVPLGERDGG
jgi:signal transduction histidine kinase